MIDVRQAAAIATDYFLDLYEDPMVRDDLLLEEVELTEDSKYWLITLGFTQAIIQRSIANNLTGILKPNVAYQRIYKVFKIKADDGTVVSMKIREIPEYSVA